MMSKHLRTTGIASALVVAAAMIFAAAPTTATRGHVLHEPHTPRAAAVNDAQIAAIVVAANTVDIEFGKLAQSKTKNEKVKQFADTMVTDHTAVNKSAVALVTKLGVTPEESETSRGLTASGEQTRARLSNLSGEDFDREYIANEVAYHKLVIDAVDKTLIPNAKNAELKAALVNVRPALVAHLEHAQQIQAELSGKRPMKKTHKH
jgi:putative membrane protein